MGEKKCFWCHENGLLLLLFSDNMNSVASAESKQDLDLRIPASARSDEKKGDIFIQSGKSVRVEFKRLYSTFSHFAFACFGKSLVERCSASLAKGRRCMFNEVLPRETSGSWKKKSDSFSSTNVIDKAIIQYVYRGLNTS